MSHKQLLPKEVINLLRKEKSIGMLFEIINSATEDDIPRLLLSIQASRSLLKRRLYCETSTVSGKKKIIDIMKLICLSLSDFSYYFPFPSTPLATFLPTAGVTITKMQSSYMFAKKNENAFNKSITIHSLCNEYERKLDNEAVLTPL